MTDCTSTYTIDRITGEKLACSGNHLLGNVFVESRKVVHTAKYAGITWTWYSSEEDKDA